MEHIEKLIEICFSLALFINALLFIPQIIKLYKDKTAKGVSLLTFGGFLLIQLLVVLHGVIHHDILLIIGYLFSMLTCGTVTVLILWYRNKNTVSKTNEITADDILAQLPEHVYWKDLNCTVLGCNTNNWRNLGYSSLKAIQGENAYDFFPKEQADAIFAADRAVMTSGKAQVLEEITDKADGTTALYLSHKAPIKKDGKIVGILGISVDITRAKAEMEQRLKMLEDVIAAIPVNVYWLDQNGYYLGCNSHQAALIGFSSAKDIIGKRNVDLTNPAIAEILDKNNQDVMNSGQEIVLEEPIVFIDGTQSIFLSTKSPLFDKNGKVIGMVGVSVDITDRKEKERLALENEARKAQMEVQDQLAHLARIDSMGALAVGIAHEINQPLSSIANYVSGIKRRLQNVSENQVPAGVFPAMDSIADQAKRAGEIIHTLKEFLRKGETERQALNVNHIIQNVLTLLKLRIIENKVMVQLKLMHDLPNITVNKVQIEQVIFNLLNNAIDAINMGHNVKRMITIRTQIYQKNALRISVVDNGVGMTTEQVQKLFTPFTTTKKTGMGVGLTMCLNIVENHLGRITTISRVGRGTIFHVILPLQTKQ